MAARRTTTVPREKVRSRATTDDGAPVVVQEGGMGFADAITIATTLLLIAAFVMMDKVLGDHFAQGLFFKP